MALPENILEQFRTGALERLERIEGSWEQVLKDFDERQAAIVHREIHTLKGESQMVGSAEVTKLCHKLEDLMDLARSRGYSVDEDFDLAVNMSLRFMGMLVRKRAQTDLTGFDLPGFMKHIDALLQATQPIGAR